MEDKFKAVAPSTSVRGATTESVASRVPDEKQKEEPKSPERPTSTSKS